ncbi:hypothetical protein ALC57_01195 [Trachymyrmex cornetzi]|uniref:Uncharacterized protein n=1 Tax=Trachymyrmex cornetzi TaxID=471704 RepID=A0A151JQ87_9HYME|nr:hypothetical protein ALC57_01195 [Trachymyrmex cornetzi]
MAPEKQGAHQITTGKERGMDAIIRSIADESAVITFEPRRESEDEMSSLKNLLISMGCVQHTDDEIVPTIPVQNTNPENQSLPQQKTVTVINYFYKVTFPPLLYAYKYLTNLRCITTRENQPMYQHSGNRSKICQNCYKYEPANLRLNYLPVFSHHLVHMDSIFEQAKCINCNKVMTVTKEAEECSDCLLEFQYIDANIKARLDLGWGLPVGLKH